MMSVGALSFGSSGNSGSAPLLKLFHSRQLGIDANGAKVPIDWGVRTTGRLGRWNMGLLDVQTDVGPLPRVGTRFPRSNFGAFRVSRNLAGRSSVGITPTETAAATAADRMEWTSICARTGRWRSTATPRALTRQVPGTRTTGRPD